MKHPEAVKSTFCAFEPFLLARLKHRFLLAIASILMYPNLKIYVYNKHTWSTLAPFYKLELILYRSYMAIRSIKTSLEFFRDKCRKHNLKTTPQKTPFSKGKEKYFRIYRLIPLIEPF
jgi:hypothetical protein